MKNQKYAKIIVVVLSAMSAQALYATDPCPCDGGTKPAVGQDACGKDVCDESLKAKSTEACCNNTVYVKTDYCCLNNELVSRSTPPSPCTPNPPNSVEKVSLPNTNYPGGTYLIDTETVFAGAVTITRTYTAKLTAGTLSNQVIASYGFEPRTDLDSQSTGCGLPVNQKNINSGFNVSAGLDFKAAQVGIKIGTGSGQIKYKAFTFSGTVTSSESPTIYPEPGVTNKIVYTKAYLGKSNLVSGDYSGSGTLVMNQQSSDPYDPLWGNKNTSRALDASEVPGIFNVIKKTKDLSTKTWTKCEAGPCCMSNNT